MRIHLRGEVREWGAGTQAWRPFACRHGGQPGETPAEQKTLSACVALPQFPHQQCMHDMTGQCIGLDCTVCLLPLPCPEGLWDLWAISENVSPSNCKTVIVLQTDWHRHQDDVTSFVRFCTHAMKVVISIPHSPGQPNISRSCQEPAVSGIGHPGHVQGRQEQAGDRHLMVSLGPATVMGGRAGTSLLAAAECGRCAFLRWLRGAVGRAAAACDRASAAAAAASSSSSSAASSRLAATSCASNGPPVLQS